MLGNETHYLIKDDNEKPYRLVPEYLLSKFEFIDKIGCDEAFELKSENEQLKAENERLGAKIEKPEVTYMSCSNCKMQSYICGECDNMSKWELKC